MVYCAAYKCTSYGQITEDVSFHRQIQESQVNQTLFHSRISTNIFPKYEKRSKAWIHKVCRENWKPSKTSVICSKHFSSDDFEPSTEKGLLKDQLCHQFLSWVKVIVESYCKIR